MPREEAIRISWDGRGRCWDNIFIERLWRSVKYEEVYLKDYADVPEALYGLGDYFDLYNTERLHQSLGYKTPQQVYKVLRRVNKQTENILASTLELIDFCLDNGVHFNFFFPEADEKGSTN